MARRKTRSYRSRARSTRSNRGSYSRGRTVRRTSRGRSGGSRGQTVRLVIQTVGGPQGGSSVGVPGTVGVAQAAPPRKAVF